MRVISKCCITSLWLWGEIRSGHIVSLTDFLRCYPFLSLNYIRLKVAVTELFRMFARKRRNIALQQEERSQFRLPPASLATLLCGFGSICKRSWPLVCTISNVFLRVGDWLHLRVVHLSPHSLSQHWWIIKLLAQSAG